MYASGLRRHVLAPSAAAEVTVAGLIVGAVGLDAPGVWIPCAESHVVVRFGPADRPALDLHVMGPRQRAHRKTLRGGQRTVMARLRLGAHRAVFGVPSSELAERIVPLDELWGDDAAHLGERLARSRDADHAAALLQDAIVQRRATSTHDSSPARLALAAAERLETSRVNDVAELLGVSERNLRRVFRETIGMSPKAFSRLARFQRALRVAQGRSPVDWAGIAVATGYYDQAHLIAEFREVAGVTPGALLRELASMSPSSRHARTSQSADALV